MQHVYDWAVNPIKVNRAVEKVRAEAKEKGEKLDETSKEFEAQVKHHYVLFSGALREVAAEPANADIATLSVTELKKLAKEQGVDISGLTKKDEILAAVKKHLEANAGEDESEEEDVDLTNK